MRPDAERWFARRTSRAVDAPDARALTARKGGQSVSVVLPARNEAATVGAVVEALVPLREIGLVDELVVIDGSSTDATAAIARRAGASVVGIDEVLPGHGSRPGKGEALWKGLAATTGDLVVFLDTDVVGVRARWVCGLLAPLLAEPAVGLVKACYERPLALPGGHEAPTAGGRVTELMARPLIAQLWPGLAGVVQPLAGECAARRSVLEQLPFEGGYAVELALLVDTFAMLGLDGLAQVDLGIRRHRHQDTAALGVMAAGILAVALGRAGLDVPGGPLVQFARDAAGRFAPMPQVTRTAARPPLARVADYYARRARAS